MDKPKLTSVVFDSLLSMKAMANAGKSQDEVRNLDRANEWLTSMSTWRRSPRRKAKIAKRR